jgi:hypothetical protein
MTSSSGHIDVPAIGIPSGRPSSTIRQHEDEYGHLQNVDDRTIRSLRAPPVHSKAVFRGLVAAGHRWLINRDREVTPA